MDELTTAPAENVREIENIPASELPQGCEWRPCKDCETLFIAPIGSKKKYCPVCLEARFAVSRSKGGRLSGRWKNGKNAETTEKENQNMPISNTLPELHKCAVCGNDFLTTKNEPMCVQCRAEYAPAKPVETCLTGKPAYHVVVREPAPVATVAAEKTASATVRFMLGVAEAVEMVEGYAEKWGVDVDTALDTINDAFGLARAINIKKSRCANASGKE